jgi:hypothetical protein
VAGVYGGAGAIVGDELGGAGCGLVGCRCARISIP